MLLIDGRRTSKRTQFFSRQVGNEVELLDDYPLAGQVNAKAVNRPPVDRFRIGSHARQNVMDRWRDGAVNRRRWSPTANTKMQLRVVGSIIKDRDSVGRFIQCNIMRISV